MKQRVIQMIAFTSFITVAFLATRQFTKQRSEKKTPLKSLASWQQADIPLGIPIKKTPPTFDPLFIKLTAFERANIPTNYHYSSPIGSENGALTYNAQAFGANNTQRGGKHTGDDLNGIGGMNTDLGDSVYAVANSLVVYNGEPSSEWGKVLILAHKTPEEKILLTMYAHLDKIYEPYHNLVPRGKKIGTVGTANNNYPAHLHFELRDGSAPLISSGYSQREKNYLNPKRILAHTSFQQPILKVILETKAFTNSPDLIILNDP